MSEDEPSPTRQWVTKALKAKGWTEQQIADSYKPGSDKIALMNEARLRKKQERQQALEKIDSYEGLLNMTKLLLQDVLRELSKNKSISQADKRKLRYYKIACSLVNSAKQTSALRNQEALRKRLDALEQRIEKA
ncbi:MAG: hypothetical protein HYU39_02290 [Thaumarchaeota archaeon]|nr:hypothetical protein [Nitrososphaerota archaeon]